MQDGAGERGRRRRVLSKLRTYLANLDASMSSP